MHPKKMQLSHYGAINSGKSFFQRVSCVAVVKKKPSHVGKGGVNGMLVALHPSGTIHQGAGQNLGGLVGASDFKMTMKHNNSNNSIHSTKKMIATIRKPNDLMGVGAGASLLGQSTQHALSSKKNNNNVQAGGLLQ